MGARKIKKCRRKFCFGVAAALRRRGGVALLAFSKNFDKMNLRNVADPSFKKGSRIFKQRAPNWTSFFLGGGSRGLPAPPAGGTRKELGGKIKRRGEIPRNNFFGNEAVRSNFLRKMSNLLRRLLRGDFSRLN